MNKPNSVLPVRSYSFVEEAEESPLRVSTTESPPNKGNYEMVTMYVGPRFNLLEHLHKERDISRQYLLKELCTALRGLNCWRETPWIRRTCHSTEWRGDSLSWMGRLYVCI